MGKLEKIEKYIKKGKADKLTALSRNDDKTVRLAAISGLGELIEYEASMNALTGLLDDSDPDIRKEVVCALGKATGSYAETQLVYCISHEKDAHVLEMAKKSLAKVRDAKKH